MNLERRLNKVEQALNEYLDGRDTRKRAMNIMRKMATMPGETLEEQEAHFDLMIEFIKLVGSKQLKHKIGLSD